MAGTWALKNLSETWYMWWGVRYFAVAPLKKIQMLCCHQPLAAHTKEKELELTGMQILHKNQEPQNGHRRKALNRGNLD